MINNTYYYDVMKNWNKQKAENHLLLKLGITEGNRFHIWKTNGATFFFFEK